MVLHIECESKLIFSWLIRIKEELFSYNDTVLGRGRAFILGRIWDFCAPTDPLFLLKGQSVQGINPLEEEYVHPRQDLLDPMGQGAGIKDKLPWGLILQDGQKPLGQ